MQITPRIHVLKIPFHVTTPAGIVLERFVYVLVLPGKEITLIDTEYPVPRGQFRLHSFHRKKPF
jgi:hypothetical protein